MTCTYFGITWHAHDMHTWIENFSVTKTLLAYCLFKTRSILLDIILLLFKVYQKFDIIMYKKVERKSSRLYSHWRGAYWEGMTIKQAERNVNDREKWRGIWKTIGGGRKEEDEYMGTLRGRPLIVFTNVFMRFCCARWWRLIAKYKCPLHSLFSPSWELCAWIDYVMATPSVKMEFSKK